MARKDSYVEYTLELLEPLGPVQARAMFGGWGLYFGGRMFGLIVEDRLFLKTDEVSRPDFESAGGEPFVYDAGKGRKPVTLSYWTPPSEASDDAHALLPWARKAVESARRASRKKAAPAKKKAPAAVKKAAPARKKSAPAKKR